jgi:hypothetical protein
MSDHIFDYINDLMNQARKGRVVERSVKVEFRHPVVSQKRTEAIDVLKEEMLSSDRHLETIKAWANKYITCKRCARGFIKWYEECEIGPEDDLDRWIEEVNNVIKSKNWI